MPWCSHGQLQRGIWCILGSNCHSRRRSMTCCYVGFDNSLGYLGQGSQLLRPGNSTGDCACSNVLAAKVACHTSWSGNTHSLMSSEHCHRFSSICLGLRVRAWESPPAAVHLSVYTDPTQRWGQLLPLVQESAQDGFIASSPESTLQSLCFSTSWGCYQGFCCHLKLQQVSQWRMAKTGLLGTGFSVAHGKAWSSGLWRWS